MQLHTGIEALLMRAVRVWTITLEVFLHRRIGERYLSVWTVLGGLIVTQAVGWMLVVGSLIPTRENIRKAPEPPPDRREQPAWGGGYQYRSGFDAPSPQPARINWGILLVPAFSLAYLAAALVHRMDIEDRRSAGVQWHSRSTGLPLWGLWDRLPWHRLPRDWSAGLDEVFVKQWVEPALCVAAGLLLRPVLGPFAWYFAAGGVLMCVEMTAAKAAWRHRVLDFIDGRIEGSQIARAVAEPPRSGLETEGFVVPGATGFTDAEASALTGAVARRDPSLRGVVSPALLSITTDRPAL